MHPVGTKYNTYDPNNSCSKNESDNDIDNVTEEKKEISTSLKKFVEERKGILTDSEIDNLSLQESRQVIKTMKNLVISDHVAVEQLRKDNIKITIHAQKALSDATNLQAAQNLAQNQTNRADYAQLNTSNIGSTILRVASVIVSIAMFVITLICIFV